VIYAMSLLLAFASENAHVSVRPGLGNPEPLHKTVFADISDRETEARLEIDQLIKTLTSETDPQKRIQILTRLASLKELSDIVAAQIVSHMNDPVFEVRATAMKLAYSKIGVKGISRFAAFVEDKSVGAYGSMGVLAIAYTYRDNPTIEISPRAMECFLKEFKNPDDERRLWATFVFSEHMAGKKGSEKALPTIVENFVKDREVRTNFAHVLVAYGERSLPYLKETLKNSDENVRLSTLVALRHLGKTSVPLLGEIAKAKSDSSAKVRSYAELAFDEVAAGAIKK
jgi:hypothetical protein